MTRSIATALLCAISLALFTAPAQAGDRELEILLVNMTPDPVGDEGRRCAEHIRRSIRGDYTRLQQQGETAFRESVGDEARVELMSYDADRLQRRRQRGDDWLDAIVLFDCRPEAGRIDVLIQSAAGGVSRIRLRDLRVDRSLLETLSAIILRHAWQGFSP
jgi:hypothetical protein